jgi:phosphofructokinase-like protein
MAKKRIGVLTGGGDCPGLNAAIRAIVYRAADYGDEIIGIKLGWKGLLEKQIMPLDIPICDEIIRDGGTILGSSRTNPLLREEELSRCLQHYSELGLEALIALGGEDTLGVALRFTQIGVNTVGVPKTMDNDLAETDYTFGFDSAVSVAMDAADRLRDTAKSHQRVLVLEVMGRHAGWVALYAGIGAGADWILIPEEPVDIDAMCDHLKRTRERGKVYNLVVASEGIDLPEADTHGMSVDAFGHIVLRERGVGEYVAKVIEERTGFPTRYAQIGHVQRGGSPSVFDRVLATRLGMRALELVHNGEFGMMASIKGNEIVAVPLEDAVSELKTVPHELYVEIQRLFK